MLLVYSRQHDFQRGISEDRENTEHILHSFGPTLVGLPKPSYVLITLLTVSQSISPSQPCYSP